MDENKNGNTCVIYARYSSHSQGEQSIEGQLHDAYEYARREEMMVVGEYIDRAKSGTRDDRAAFQRMIKDSDKKQFKFILVWKLDRFARNRYDSAIYKAKLKKNGVRVISIMERIQDDPEGIILEGMLESMAEYYSANLSVNIKRGQRETTAKGKYCGGQIPYGYKAENGRLVEDPHTAPVIREVFQRYAAGESMVSIVEDLNGRGIRTSSGTQLTRVTFTRALSNTVYIGRMKYKDQIVEGCADQLIDQSTFDQVQIRIAAHKQAPAARKAQEPYLLQGKVYCGICGAKMVSDNGRSAGGKCYKYYSCRNKKSAAKGADRCVKKPEKKDYLEEYVVGQTVNYVLREENMRRISRALVQQYDKEFGSKNIQAKERAIAKAESEILNLTDCLMDAPKAARQRIYDKIETLEAQKADMEIDLAKLKIATDIRFTEAEIMAWLRQFCTDPVDAAAIIDTFVNSVYVFEDRIVILYNTKNSAQISLSDLGGQGSNSEPIGGPFEAKFEHPKIFYLKKCFGIIMQRVKG